MPFGVFASVGVLDFFHSVKKVFSVKHLCIKEDLGYLHIDVVLHNFLQGKTFCNFVFSFICMIYTVYFFKVWKSIDSLMCVPDFLFSGERISWRRVIFSGGIFIEENFPGGKFLGVIFTVGSFHRGLYS